MLYDYAVQLITEGKAFVCSPQGPSLEAEGHPSPGGGVQPSRTGPFSLTP